MFLTEKRSGGWQRSIPNVMEKIIDGKRYDTETADKIASSPAEQAGQVDQPPADQTSSPAGSLPSVFRDSVKMFREAQLPEAGDLYRTKKGNYFVRELRSGQIVPVSRDEAMRWCKKFTLFEVVKQHFSGHVEEA